MVEVGMEDDEMTDGFRRDIELMEMVQEGVGDCAHPSFDNDIGLPPDKIEIEKFASKEGDMIRNLKRQFHKISLTHPCV